MTACAARPDFPSTDGGAPEANITIARLREALAGVSVTLSDSIVIEGRITATDAAGNFYKEFILDDGTGAVGIMAGGFDLHSTYPLGIKVVVRLCGLRLAWNQGVPRIGLAPAPGSAYDVDYMQHRAVCDRYIVRIPDSCRVRPALLTIGELDASMCGRLVQLRSLHPADSADTWFAAGDYGSSARRKFKDRQGDSIYVITSRYAIFADKTIPSEASLTGILYSDGRNFMLRLRDEKDIDLR